MWTFSKKKCKMAFDSLLKSSAIRPYFLFDPFYLSKLLVVFLVLRDF